jgi:ribosomal protein S16
MPLTNIAINAAKPQDKPYKLADSGGLYLLVDKTGGKYWRLKYRFLGKEKTLALGVYPTISLADAREKRDAAKKELVGGSDPGLAKKTRKFEAKIEAASTFESVALEWHEKQSVKWSAKNAQRTLSLFKNYVFPVIGSIPISHIKPADLLKAIRF